MSAHRAFELAINELRKNIRMNLMILRGLFVLQMLIFALFFILNVKATVTGQAPLSFDGYKTIIILSFAVYLLWPVIVWVFRRRSQCKFRERTRRGASLVTEEELSRLLPPGSIPLSDGLNLPCEFENVGVFVAGATGVGKTQLLSRVISSPRVRSARAVIFDAKESEFVAKFYNPETDLIFNPFDARSLHWNVFDVIQSDPDFDAVAASIIPQGHSQHEFFTTAARDVIAGILRYCHLRQRTSNDDIWLALCQPIRNLHRMLLAVESGAASTIEQFDSGQSQGVVSTMMQHAKIFRYLVNPEQKAAFSLRDWVRKKERPGFIFLSSNTKQRQTLRGIFSLFINALANEILSLRDDLQRRIFLIVDEFGTLHALPSIKDLLALGRSKGCSFWIGIQEKSQIDAVYGRDLANTIINQCNNYLIFRMNDSDSAEYFSRLFGEQEIESMESSFSSGSRDYRDSESYRKLRTTDKLLLPSQIQTIPNLTFYVKLSGLPLTKSSIQYRNYPDKVPAFIPNLRFLATSDNKTGPEDSGKANSNQTLTRTISKQTELTGMNEDYRVEDFDF